MKNKIVQVWVESGIGLLILTGAFLFLNLIASEKVLWIKMTLAAILWTGVTWLLITAIAAVCLGVSWIVCRVYRLF